MKRSEFEVRDLRRKEKFVIDDDYLNGYAKKCGWKATLVYLSLCRHSDKNQTCFPSISLIATEHAISVNSARRGITDLEKWNIIRVTRAYDNKTKKYLNNIYTLIDKTNWGKIPNSQRPVRAVDKKKPAPPGEQASAPWGTSQRPVVIHKDTHIKDTHIREREITLLKKKNYTSLKDLTPSVLKEISDQYEVPPAFVENVREDLELYCESKGKRYVNYKAALINWVKRDRARLFREQKLSSKKRGGVVDARKL